MKQNFRADEPKQCHNKQVLLMHRQLNGQQNSMLWAVTGGMARDSDYSDAGNKDCGWPDDIHLGSQHVNEASQPV
jgi:hypothetical protein